MKQEKSTNDPKDRSKISNHLVAKKLSQLKNLTGSRRDRPLLIAKLAGLRKDGVPLNELAKYTGFSARSICRWLSLASTVESASRPVTLPKRNSVKAAKQAPQMKIVEVVPSEHQRRIWPRINLRAEWMRIRFNIDLI